MKTLTFNGKTYEVDDHHFLLDHKAWDKDFAAGIARMIGMEEDLTKGHWEVIDFIQNRFRETRACPVVHETAQALGLSMTSLQRLFPTGYLRGACLIAGISYKYGWVYYFEEPYPVPHKPAPEKEGTRPEEKVYRVDLFGSLVDPAEWDEDFALRRAYEMNMKGGLTDKHWQIIKFLRESYARNQKIPTFYECCEANGIDIKDLAELFPTGYHRGAVKIAGLPTYGKQ